MATKKVMTFQQAVTKLKKVSKGKYHTITYSYSDGEAQYFIPAVECKLYIDGFGFHSPCAC